MAPWEARLVRDDGLEIRPGDLSSGERVLLATAMSLFTGSHFGQDISMPRLLLLDEADASLHPSMVKSLLTVLEEIFVRSYGVCVILTTHSPSTVALAPDDSIFAMNPTAPRLAKSSKDQALKSLTVGVPSMSVSIENQAQVFVESEIDQALYQSLFALSRPRLDSIISLNFIAAARRERGGGCDAVIHLVTALRAAGASKVFGIVDRDSRRKTPEHVHFSSERHSIENFLLDPLLVGVLCLRERVMTPEDLGLNPGIKYFDLTESDYDVISANICRRIGLEGDLFTCRYAGGFSLQVPDSALNMRGHDLEALIIERIPQIHSVRGDLKTKILELVIADLEDLTPYALVELFAEIAR